ncbi:GrpB family protein [Propionibacteriaceae bacterium Y2011]|uniref:GrpB family protein n=1 Tax=Microlunatus sp. Y2014 TaxID=3418488 RepID=UPI003B4EEA3D
MTELHAYDPHWADEFARTAAQLRSVGDPSWAFEHIGSTSVPGLPAKPIIDLAVRVSSLDEVSAHDASLTAGGWLAIRRQPGDHLVRVRQRGNVRTHIAHFFAAADWDACHQRMFRDWLREHPDDRDRYAAAKRAASAVAGPDYTRTKAPVVLEIVNRARAARGLGPLADLDSGV